MFNIKRVKRSNTNRHIIWSQETSITNGAVVGSQVKNKAEKQLYKDCLCVPHFKIIL